MTAPKHTVLQLRNILDRFVRAERSSQDAAEVEFDAASAQARALPREGIFEALDAAVGRSKPRRKAAIYILAELAELPEAVERIRHELGNPDWRMRSQIIGMIGRNAWTQCAPYLNEIMLHDPEDLCRRAALSVAGHLRDDVNLPVILELARRDYPDLSWTLKDYGCEEGRLYLRRAFERPIGAAPTVAEITDVNNPDALRKVAEWSSRRSGKVIAAWGLARLRDVEAIEYLGQMLYDRDIGTGNTRVHGQSLRAAQAIADLCGLPFEWSLDYVPPIRQWWESNRQRVLSGPENWVNTRHDAARESTQ